MSLVLQWDFASGNANDTSGNANHGISVGSPVFAANVVTLNGTTDYFTFTNLTGIGLSSSTSEFSLAAWFNSSLNDGNIMSLRSSSSGNQIIDCCIGANAVDNNGTGKPSMIVRDDSGGGITWFSSSASVQGGLHFVVWTRNSSKLNKIYIDSVADGSATDTMGSSVTPTLDKSAIGFELLNGANKFTGVMGNGTHGIYIYNHALSQSEINALYTGSDTLFAQAWM